MKRMLVLTVLSALPFAPLSHARAQSPNHDEEAAIKQMVDGYMQPFLQQNNDPGAIVGVSLHGRRYFFTYGQATDGGTPFTSTTLVEIGSCTKVFTTTLFSLAIARNQILPNASAQQYMPVGFTLRPLAQQITPLQLADFTSGMPDSPTDLPNGPVRRNIDHYTVKNFLGWASNWRPNAPPPAPYLYSNAGIGLLSYLVATATNQPWEQQLNQEILSPLGMVDTQLRPSSSQLERSSQGHLANGNAARPWPVFAWFAAGGLRSTAADMLRFGEANLGHPQIEGHSISPELIAAMKAAQAPIYQIPNKDAKQGMAWAINVGDNPAMHPEILKNGGTAGFNTVILLNPAKDAAIFIAINKSGNPANPIAVEIGRHLP